MAGVDIALDLTSIGVLFDLKDGFLDDHHVYQLRIARVSYLDPTTDFEVLLEGFDIH